MWQLCSMPMQLGCLLQVRTLLGVTSLPAGVTSLIPPQREAKAILVPSGDQAGSEAPRANNVRRVPFARMM